MTLEFKEVDYWAAGFNWVKWKDDYAKKKLKDLSILNYPLQFKLFWKDYSLLRGERGETRPPLREWLQKNLNVGSDVECVAKNMKDNNDLKNKHVSMLTKILCLADPKTFFPMDSLAKEGLHKLDGGIKKPLYANYNDRCKAVFNNVKNDLEKFLNKRTLPTESKEAFSRRVLDAALMRIGRDP